MKSNAIVRVEQVTKIYDEGAVPVQALRGVTLTIEPGAFTVIAGPSGSGKTTLLNVLGALDVPTTGRVFFEGQDLSKLSRRERARLRLYKIGFVFQAYNLIPVLTALENVAFVLLLQGVPERERRRRALEILEQLGIADLAHKRPHEMSGGQQQRVAVASSNGSRWPAPWSASHAWCWPTNPPPTSTRPPAPACLT